MFKSKMILDPTQVRGNRRGMTVGLVFYTPKYWSCKTYDFYASQFDHMKMQEDGTMILSDKEKEERYQAKKAHANCKRKHMSYKGYMYWVGPKRRYQLHYMGDINPYNSNPGWGYVKKHGQYVRWFDNGPQNPPREPLDPELRAVLNAHSREFNASLASAREQMEEYAAKRDAGWTP